MQIILQYGLSRRSLKEMIRLTEESQAAPHPASLEDLLALTTHWPDNERRRLLVLLRVLEKQWNAPEWKSDTVLHSLEDAANLFHRNRAPWSPGEVVTFLCTLLNGGSFFLAPDVSARSNIDAAVATMKQRMMCMEAIQ